VTLDACVLYNMETIIDKNSSTVRYFRNEN